MTRGCASTAAATQPLPECRGYYDILGGNRLCHKDESMSLYELSSIALLALRMRFLSLFDGGEILAPHPPR